MNTIRKALNYIWLHGWKYRVIERQHQNYIAQLRGRKQVNVVFTAINVSLWHYQKVYELMAADARFNASIVLTPCTSHENYEKEMEGLRHYFDNLGIGYVDLEENGKPIDIKKLNPDIIFYTQPYEYLLADNQDCRFYYDRLICYIPYAFWTGAGKISYNLHFHNLAWRLYYSNDMHLKDAQRTATNHGRNVRVTGYPDADLFLSANHDDVWRTMGDGKQRKRLIWAPHYSIWEKAVFSPQSNFLWMADFMLAIAQEYKDRIQFAFKPHSALLTQLYKHPDWGKKRADDYYERWRTMANAQLETGDFIDLFMTSDAMIHDCGSFRVEYHYTKNPVMYMLRSEVNYTIQNDFGKKAQNLHYIGHNEADIRHFIDDIVLGGQDPMRPQREQFFHEYLLPPDGKSVAQNVLDDIVESLHL